MKACPRCAEQVQTAAQVCRYCNHDFDGEVSLFGYADDALKLVVKLVTSIAVLLFIVYACVAVDLGPVVAPGPLHLEDAVEPILGEAAFTERQVEADKDASCSARYPSNYTMRAACERNATRGHRDFVRIWNAHLADDVMLRSLSGCHRRYTETGATDWSMAGACARNNQHGRSQIHGS